MENNSQNTKNLQILTAIAVVLFFALIGVLIYQYVQFWKLNAYKHNLDNQLETLTDQIQSSSEQLDYMTSEDYLEYYARETLNNSN